MAHAGLFGLDPREEVQRQRIPLPNEDEVKEIAANFNLKLDKIIPKGSAQSWWALYKDIDEDQSGLITFEEFASATRERLGIKPTQLSDNKLMALWCVLDADNSGYLESGEFHTFMGRVSPELAGRDDARRKLIKTKTASKRQMNEDLSNRELELEGFVSEYKTETMRADLAAENVEPLNDEEKKKAAIQFQKWVKAYIPDRNETIAWMLVFKEVGGGDSSGLVTYNELRQVIRFKFKLPPSKISENDIKNIWCSLDVDNEDTIAQVVMARWLKLAQGAKRSSARSPSPNRLPAIRRWSPVSSPRDGEFRPVSSISRRPKVVSPKEKWVPPDNWNRRIWAPTTLETNYLGGPWVPMARPATTSAMSPRGRQ